MRYHKLVAAAQKAKRFSHSPFSKFKVGAAILTHTGRIYTGCNIENSSFSLTICAERTALFKAVSEGQRNFVAVAIAADSASMIPPCGACRQVLMDLAGDVEVVMTNRRGKKKIARLRDLLPHPFLASNLPRRARTVGRTFSRKK